jgi:HlyD family secretion protein
MKRAIIVGSIIVVVLGVAAVLVFKFKPSAQPQFRTSAVTRGDLERTITATGTVNPRQTVAVGTQVSGTVARLEADFNSMVKKGQVIAKLDATLLEAAVEDANASLERAQAQVDLTKNIVDRTQSLFQKDLTSQADLEQAQANYKGALAGFSSARASLQRAKINLSYATITSPINGVVISRNVDMGQTVAASLNTPTLFLIADDLTAMQVSASVDEGDIGQVAVGQNANFTVDAFPDRKFSGTISQKRLQPNTVQNVVTYTVMIDVKNPDRVLMPGMTATITIPVQSAQNAILVPAAALKFTPANFTRSSRGRTGADSTRFRGGRHTGGDSTSFTRGTGQRRQDSSAAGQSAGISSNRQGRSRDRVFILENGKPKYVPVTVLLNNGGSAAVQADLTEGQLVIVGTTVSTQTSQNQTKQGQQNPFQQTPPVGGMGRRF